MRNAVIRRRPGRTSAQTAVKSPKDHTRKEGAVTFHEQINACIYYHKRFCNASVFFAFFRPKLKKSKKRVIIYTTCVIMIWKKACLIPHMITAFAYNNNDNGGCRFGRTENYCRYFAADSLYPADCLVFDADK